MTREEAIEIVKKHGISADGTKFESALRELIPELAESEDERIRRKMLEHFRSKTKETWCNIPVKDIITYLEKQKELTTDDIYSAAHECIYGEEKQKEQKPAEWSEDEFHKTTNLVYKAIRKALASLAVYAEDEALLDSKEENLCYYSQRCTEEIFKFLRPSWKPSKEELAKKHLDGYCMGREDTLREMKDFVESHFNCENAKKGTPIVYNTQSGTSTLKAEG